MIINKKTIIPAKFLKIDEEGYYCLLCYFAFDDVREKRFDPELFKERSDYYYILTDMENGKLKINIESANEYVDIIKEKYE